MGVILETEKAVRVGFQTCDTGRPPPSGSDRLVISNLSGCGPSTHTQRDLQVRGGIAASISVVRG